MVQPYWTREYAFVNDSVLFEQSIATGFLCEGQSPDTHYSIERSGDYWCATINGNAARKFCVAEPYPVAVKAIQLGCEDAI
ncbi:hypothetical protein [Candidatus Chlorohelix sp.]|uniref:hypothetical protein n=1 Tax=Candidatus Chlorohelix sp. TaxID=3139201 RepID=UPI00305077A6